MLALWSRGLQVRRVAKYKPVAIRSTIVSMDHGIPRSGRGGESRVYTGSMTAGVSIDARLTIGEISYALKSADGGGSSIARSSGTVVFSDSQWLS